MSFLGPACNRLSFDSVFARLERSLRGAKMLRRDPRVFRRNVTWLGEVRSDQDPGTQIKVSTDFHISTRA